jgi:simple sugar transport system ATP-binding protein
MQPHANAQDRPIVELKGITKRFGKVVANDNVSLAARPGRILALLGENGAGKSTLMSILAGRYHADEGEIVVDGEPTRFASPKEAIAAGVGMVYQHFMLVDSMTVAQNVLLGQEKGFWIRPARVEAEVGELAERYGLGIDPRARVHELSMGERQRVEILKLLYRESRVLIFDEPTSVLTPPETAHLFKALRQMAAAGKAIIFISHKLEEVLSLADDIAVLRKGRVVDAIEAHTVSSKAELANKMVGREVLLDVARPQVEMGEEVMRIEGLSGSGLEDVSLSLRRGEVLAVVGVAGNGQKPLVEILAGLREPSRGEVSVLGLSWREFHRNPQWDESLIYIPEDRLGVATCRELDLVDNVLLTTRKGFCRGPFLQGKLAEATTGELVEAFNVATHDVSAKAAHLSGGNLQKLVLAREFYRRPRIIIAEAPTQGLDISATEEVWRRLIEARKTAGVLLVTGDVAEALALADRIAVICRGRFMDVFDAADEERVNRIGLLMAGVTESDAA